MGLKTDLSVNIGKLKLKNPVMLASGTCGYGKEFGKIINLEKLGAIVTKTITLNPRLGNPPPRTVETPAGMLNAIGLDNPGVEKFIKEKMPFITRLGVPVVVSVGGESTDEIIKAAEKLEAVKSIDALELNISCPNIRGPQSTVHSPQKKNYRPLTMDYGLIAQSPRATYNLVKVVRKTTAKTLIVKLSPNVTDITEIAVAAEDAGSDALSLINTLYGMSVDIDDKTPSLANVTGGLSGPAIKPVALKMVWDVYRKIKLPIIGIGGIMNTNDALEFIICGASAVQVGTANFVNPNASIEIVNGINRYLKNNKIANIKKLIGNLKNT